MAGTSWLLTAVGWFWILAGTLVSLLGLALIGAIFSGKGIPVGAAGMFVLITLIAGPLLAIAGPIAILSGIKLMSGHAWARTFLEVLSWVGLLGSVGYLVYSAVDQNEILMEDVIKGAFFFLFTGVPLILVLFILRSDALRRALARITNL